MNSLGGRDGASASSTDKEKADGWQPSRSVTGSQVMKEAPAALESAGEKGEQETGQGSTHLGTATGNGVRPSNPPRTDSIQLTANGPELKVETLEELKSWASAHGSSTEQVMDSVFPFRRVRLFQSDTGKMVTLSGLAFRSIWVSAGAEAGELFQSMGDLMGVGPEPPVGDSSSMKMDHVFSTKDFRQVAGLEPDPTKAGPPKPPPADPMKSVVNHIIKGEWKIIHGVAKVPPLENHRGADIISYFIPQIDVGGRKFAGLLSKLDGRHASAIADKLFSDKVSTARRNVIVEMVLGLTRRESNLNIRRNQGIGELEAIVAQAGSKRTIEPSGDTITLETDLAESEGKSKVLAKWMNALKASTGSKHPVPWMLEAFPKIKLGDELVTGAQFGLVRRTIFSKNPGKAEFPWGMALAGKAGGLDAPMQVYNDDQSAAIGPKFTVSDFLMFQFKDEWTPGLKARIEQELKQLKGRWGSNRFELKMDEQWNDNISGGITMLKANEDRFPAYVQRWKKWVRDWAAAGRPFVDQYAKDIGVGTRRLREAIMLYDVPDVVVLP